MLQKQTVYPDTWRLLVDLMQWEHLQSFNLVGGTALSLHYGHRISVDLDLFSFQEFETDRLKFLIQEAFAKIYNIERIVERERSLILTMNDIKVDIIRFPYENIRDILHEENIRLTSVEDIGAMKLNAIAKRGAKKDFFDVYELLHQGFSLDDLLKWYKEKFANHEIGHVIRSLLYFDDAEQENDPIMIKKYTWKEVKKYMMKVVREFLDV